MNILYVHRTRGRDVEGVHIRGIVDALRQLGHDVRVLSVPGADPYRNLVSANHTRSKGIWTKISHASPQIVFELLEYLYNIFVYLQCKSALKERSVDLIYERYALNTFGTTLFAKRHRIPIVHEVNDATGILRVRTHRFESLARKIEAWVFSNSDHVLTISSHFREILLARGIFESKCSYLPNAVNDRKFDPALFNGQIRRKFGLENKIIIGFAGRFAKWHGIELLLRTMPRISQEVPNAHFILIGDGITFPMAREWIRENNLHSRVTLTGTIPFELIPEYLDCLDICVIPDSNTYGSPMKLFEYMAMGKTAVAPDLGPIRDVAIDGQTVVLFPRGDAIALENSLLYLSKNEDVRQRIGNAARALVLEKHSWKANAGEILSIYNALKIQRSREYT